MILIIPRIPEITTQQDIRDFLAPGLKRLFRKSSTIDKVRIVIYKDLKTNCVEYHALVYVDSDNLGKKLIKNFNAKLLNNKLVAVREYFIRHYSNDRRMNHILKNDKGSGKRISDRRRGSMLQDISTTISVTFDSYKDFSRKLL